MPNFVYIATSIDGFIAKKDGNIDWLLDIPNPSGSDYGYSEFMQRIDGIVMGRNTFEKVLEFNIWPYSKMIFVLSNTLKSVPRHLDNRAEIVNGDLNSIIEKLNSRGFENLYIDGGKTIQSFLRNDMIDELIITRIPIVLGSGIPLFENNGIELEFRHVETKVYSDTLVKSRYIRAR